MHILDVSGIITFLNRADTWNVVSAKILLSTNCWLSTKITEFSVGTVSEKVEILVVCEIWKVPKW